FRLPPFGGMPSVRTPQAPQNARPHAFWDAAFPIERRGRPLRPRSISGRVIRSLVFRPTASPATLRSARYRTPRKALYLGAGSALPGRPSQAAEFQTLARRNSHTTGHTGPVYGVAVG